MTGSGKTAAFLIPILVRLQREKRGACRVLILTPTRELAAQIHANFVQLGRYTDIRAATVFGGVAMEPQITAFKQGIDVIIACPGRLLDHWQRKPSYVCFDQLDILVLDEADRMLDMGFYPDLQRIIGLLPSRPRQTLFYSATMPKEAVQLAKKLVKPSAVACNIDRQATPATGITHAVYRVHNNMKRALLLALIHQKIVRSAIIFTRTKANAKQLSKFLNHRGLSAEQIHGNRSQPQRTAALAGFQAGTYQFLVATDVLQRGIDCPDLEHVINFHVPHICEDYIHRVGRTARAEATGEAITFVAPEEEEDLRQIERAIGFKIDEKKCVGFERYADREENTEYTRMHPTTTTVLKDHHQHQHQQQRQVQSRSAVPQSSTLQQQEDILHEKKVLQQRQQELEQKLQQLQLHQKPEPSPAQPMHKHQPQKSQQRPRKQQQLQPSIPETVVMASATAASPHAAFHKRGYESWRQQTHTAQPAQPAQPAVHPELMHIPAPTQAPADKSRRRRRTQSDMKRKFTQPSRQDDN